MQKKSTDVVKGKIKQFAQKQIKVAKDKNFGKNVGEVGKQEVQWIDHRSKHVPPKGISWKKIVESTANKGKAKYHPNLRNHIEHFEREAWETGTIVLTPQNSNKTWKVKAFDFVCGASEGKETKYIRIECSSGVIHGHPIAEREYKKLLKRR
ncbi:hypothetical protein ACFLYH_02905 [Candidatus Dependentiae bacterium]